MIYFKHLLWILISLTHILIPALYRKYSPRQLGMDNFDRSFWPSTTMYTWANSISILNMVISFPVIYILNWFLSQALDVHASQAKALALLGIGTDSKEARPEPLLQYYVDLIGNHHGNLDCWLFARDHLRVYHKKKEFGATAIIPPVFIVIVTLVIILAIRFVVEKQRSSVFIWLGFFDFAWMAVWLVFVILKVVAANTALKEKHLQCLEICRHENVSHLRELVTQEGQLLKRRKINLHDFSESYSQESHSRESRGSIIGEIEYEEEIQDPDEIRQKIRELELLNLRLEASMSKVQHLDDPITLLGIVVNQQFLLTILGVVTSAATIALETLISG